MKRYEKPELNKTDFLPEGLVCASITKLEFRPEVDEYTNKGGEEFIFD